MLFPNFGFVSVIKFIPAEASSMENATGLHYGR